MTYKELKCKQACANRWFMYWLKEFYDTLGYTVGSRDGEFLYTKYDYAPNTRALVEAEGVKLYDFDTGEDVTRKVIARLRRIESKLAEWNNNCFELDSMVGKGEYDLPAGEHFLTIRNA